MKGTTGVAFVLSLLVAVFATGATGANGASAQQTQEAPQAQEAPHTQEAQEQTGELDGAPYRIQIPAQWNGNLVMYTHGYKPRGVPWLPLGDILADVFLDRGFALDSKPELAAEFAGRWELREGDLAAILGLYHLIYREMVDRAGGNPIDNRDTVYQGYTSAPGLNEAVHRYAADPKAAEYAREHYTPTGIVTDPVLAVHTTYDPGVPPRLPSHYDVAASLRDNGRWFVQQYVEADGHCSIGPVQTGRAFDELRMWAATGTPPEAGLVQ